MHLCNGKMTHVRHTQLTKVSLVKISQYVDQTRSRCALVHKHQITRTWPAGWRSLWCCKSHMKID